MGPRRKGASHKDQRRLSGLPGEPGEAVIADENDAEFQRLLRQEELILEAAKLICEAMDRRGVTRAELARRAGKSRGMITQLLSGGRNMTLRTLSDLGFHLGLPPFTLGVGDMAVQPTAAAAKNAPHGTLISN